MEIWKPNPLRWFLRKGDCTGYIGESATLHYKEWVGFHRGINAFDKVLVPVARDSPMRRGETHNPTLGVNRAGTGNTSKSKEGIGIGCIAVITDIAFVWTSLLYCVHMTQPLFIFLFWCSFLWLHDNEAIWEQAGYRYEPLYHRLPHPSIGLELFQDFSRAHALLVSQGSADA